MKRSLFVCFALHLVCIYASPTYNNRIANGEKVTDAPHACIILVVNPTVGDGNAILGGGSIISDRHVLTTASLVLGNSENSFQIGYRLAGSSTFRRVDANVAVAHPYFNPTTLENDIALIFLPVSAPAFPAGNRIAINADIAVPAANAVGRLVSYGFTEPGNNSVSANAISASQTVAADATGCNGTSTHFCAQDSAAAPAIVCLGDGGSGLFIGAATTPTADENGPDPSETPTPPTQTPPTDPQPTETPPTQTPPTETPPTETPPPEDTPRLVGLVSRIINTSCAVAAPVAYTRVGIYQEWILTMAGISSSGKITFIR